MQSKNTCIRDPTKNTEIVEKLNQLENKIDKILLSLEETPVVTGEPIDRFQPTTCEVHCYLDKETYIFYSTIERINVESLTFEMSLNKNCNFEKCWIESLSNLIEFRLGAYLYDDIYIYTHFGIENYNIKGLEKETRYLLELIRSFQKHPLKIMNIKDSQDEMFLELKTKFSHHNEY